MGTTEILMNILSYGASMGEVAVYSIRDNIKFAVEELNAKPNKLYDAEFGNPTELLSPTNNGFVITGTEAINKDISKMNMACIGQTGCGKTSINIIPYLLSITNGSAVVHCPSGQCPDATGNDFVERGFRVYIFDPNNHEGSVMINPLDFISDINQINKLSNHLVKSSLGDRSSEKFWELASVGALNVFISLLLLQPKQFRNITNLKYMIDCFLGNPKMIHILAARAPEELYSQYRALIAGSEKTLKSVMMSVSACLSLWGDENIKKITSSTNVDFSAFRKSKSILFLKNDTLQAQYMKPLLSLIIEQMFQIFMKELPKPGELDIAVCIDECATLRLDSLSQIISNNRKYNICILVVFQNISQVYNNFGKDDGSTILANCHNKIYYGGMDMRTDQDLCELLGKRTVQDGNGNEVVANLMNASNIRMLKPNEILFICGAHRPYRLQVKPFYLVPKLRKRTQKRFKYKNPNPVVTVQLLPLK